MKNELQKISKKQISSLLYKTENNGYNGILQDLVRGLRYSHIRINSNTSKTLKSCSFLYALIEILNEKGIISIEELDERKKQVAERLVKKFTESGIGLMYQDPEYDKYTFEHEAHVACLERLPICKAICCKFPFALSRQDVEEGIVRWNFGRPYLIAHGEDGYCAHLGRKTYLCTVREHRPVPCRGFDCSRDKRYKVWEDFNKMIINSELIESFEKSNTRVNSGIYHYR